MRQDRPPRSTVASSLGRRRLLGGGAAGAALATVARLNQTRAAPIDTQSPLRVGLIGCGARGTGAVRNLLSGVPNTTLVAMGDLFKSQIDRALAELRDRPGPTDAISVGANRMFVGFDAYRELLETHCDLVILAAPPGFRPVHLEAAVAAGKHVFAEKPVAVDGPGIRTCLAVADEADRRGLAVGVGLQRRHSRGYQETIRRIRAGQIGEIVGGRCAWLQSDAWFKVRQPTWTDVEWQIRNWLYFTWLSGDHIVEQHIHNLDVIQWAIGSAPVAAVGMGGRQQRTDPMFGHIYDHFAVDFEFENGVHVASMARQIPGCHDEVFEELVGTRGRAHLSANAWRITRRGGNRTFSHDAAQDPVSYVQEQVDLASAIRAGRPYNELRSATESNLTAIMGRMSAYTGKRITREMALNSRENLGPPGELKFGELEVAKVAIPGTLEVI